MSYSQSEKPANTSDEPLVLRPPVGPEVDRGLGVQFRTLFHASGNSSRRNRLICHCVLSIFLALLTALVLLLVLFILGISHMLPSHSSPQNYWGHQSMCRVSIPELRLHVTEMVSVDDNMFNVTLLGADNSASKLTRILHLCKDGLTVIRTIDRCYIRPMRADWRRMCSRGPVRLFEDGIRMRSTVSARVHDEAWFSEPLTDVPKLILNSFILALCDGVPALRLVSKPPWGYTANTMMSPVAERPHVDDTAADSDSLEVLSALMSPESVLPSTVQGPLVVRYAREATPANEEPATDSEVTDPVMVASQTRAGSAFCRHADSVLEDAVLTADTESDQVSVTLDKIMICPSST